LISSGQACSLSSVIMIHGLNLFLCYNSSWKEKNYHFLLYFLFPTDIKVWYFKKMWSTIRFV